MKTTKRLIFILCCILASAIATQAATIASGTCGKNGDNLTWNLSHDGILTISGIGEMQDYSYNNHAPWRGYSDIILTVTINDNVTSIGDYAFSGCTSLLSVPIPNAVTIIGNYAFSGCTNLRTITIPNSVITIGNGAFNNCSKLTSVTIPNSVTSIGTSAFFYCTGLTSITIPNSVTSIGTSAFSYCTGLTSITIPNSVTSIGNDAFQYCKGLTSITIPNSVTSIGGYAFYNCTNLRNIDCQAIRPPYAQLNSFSVYSLATLYVPEGCVETYKADEVWGKFVTIKNYVVSSGTCGKNGNNLTYVLTDNGQLTISGTGEMQDYSSYTSVPWYSNREKIRTVTINDNVTSIGGYAFYNCKYLTSITIPNSVTSIGRYAFYDCM